jgi:NADP-dependent 3-hydroxy acid dehydrogenase YdfG
VRPGSAEYAATKAGVLMLSEGLRQEVKPYNTDRRDLAGGGRDRTAKQHHRARFHQYYEANAIPADSFASMVIFAMSQPEGGDVNEIVLRATRQELWVASREVFRRTAFSS